MAGIGDRISFVIGSLGSRIRKVEPAPVYRRDLAKDYGWRLKELLGDYGEDDTVLDTAGFYRHPEDMESEPDVLEVDIEELSPETGDMLSWPLSGESAAINDWPDSEAPVEYGSVDLVTSEPAHEGSSEFLPTGEIERFLSRGGDLIIASRLLENYTTTEYLEDFAGLHAPGEKFNDVQRYGRFIHLRDYTLTGSTKLAAAETIYRVLSRNDGFIRQSEIAEKTEWSEATVSRKLSELEEEGRISREYVGRQKFVSFPQEDLDIETR